MTNTERELAHQLIAACEALLKNANRTDAELVRSALNVAKDHYAAERPQNGE